MKINGSINGGFDTKRAEQADEESKSPTTAVGNKALGSDRVEVSNKAQIFSKASGPEVPSQEKIATLKQAIAEGKFTIDLSRVTTRMMEEGR